MPSTEVIVKRLALLATIVGGGYAAYKIHQELRSAGKSNFLSSTYNVLTDTAASIIPSSDAATAGFSNFARRTDLDKPLDIADQPLNYGQVIPV
jgi:hypothetical protein